MAIIEIENRYMETENIKYNFKDHCNRYACWTAARAGSVSRFSNAEISKFVKQINLQEEVEEFKTTNNISHEVYKNWFLKKVMELEELMRPYKKEVAEEPKKLRNISFGIAAKVISIYVKTYEIIPSQGKSLLSKFAFPPIDSFLLERLKDKSIPGIDKTNWSKFKKEEYIQLIEKLRVFMVDQPFWMLEENWDINKPNNQTA